MPGKKRCMRPSSVETRKAVVSQIGKFVGHPPEQLAEHIQEPVYMVVMRWASMVNYWRQVLGRRTGDSAEPNFLCRRRHLLGLLAAEQLLAGESLDPVSAAPLYVRASEAELNLPGDPARSPGLRTGKADTDDRRHTMKFLHRRSVPFFQKAMIIRRQTREIAIGTVRIGNNHPLPCSR